MFQAPLKARDSSRFGAKTVTGLVAAELNWRSHLPGAPLTPDRLHSLSSSCKC